MHTYFADCLGRVIYARGEATATALPARLNAFMPPVRGLRRPMHPDDLNPDFTCCWLDRLRQATPLLLWNLMPVRACARAGGLLFPATKHTRGEMDGQPNRDQPHHNRIR